MFKLLAKRRKVEDRLRHELGRDPGDERVDDVLGLSEDQRGLVEQARRSGRVLMESSAGARGAA